MTAIHMTTLQFTQRPISLQSKVVKFWHVQGNCLHVDLTSLHIRIIEQWYFPHRYTDNISTNNSGKRTNMSVLREASHKGCAKRQSWGLYSPPPPSAMPLLQYFPQYTNIPGAFSGDWMCDFNWSMHWYVSACTIHLSQLHSQLSCINLEGKVIGQG